MYYIVFVLLLFFSVIEVYRGKRNKFWFNALYILMSFMAIFRYGQLTDYFNYEMNYENPEAMWRDPLFSMVLVGCSSIGISFTLFSMLMDVVIMGLSYPFFSKLCKGSIAALFVFYCYVFLVLPMSAIRQGLCLAVLLYCFPLLLTNQRKKFYILAFVGGFVHVSMFSVMLIGFFFDKDYFNKWFVKWVVLGFTVFALVTPDLSNLIPEFIVQRATSDVGESKWMQVTLRLVLVIPLLFVKPQKGTMEYYGKAICILGYCLYCFLSFSLLVSARIEYFFRVFMCLFVAAFLLSKRRIYLDKFVLCSILLIHVVLFFKNMNAFIAQGQYNENKVSMFNFPYVSIFDKEELDMYK